MIIIIPANIYVFKINNKNTRKTSLTSFGVFIVNFVLISHFFSVSVVEFEQVNVNWDISAHF